MSKQRPNTATESRPEECPTAWFAEMQLAAERGNYSRAALAQQQLARLGWIVNHLPRADLRQRRGGPDR
jgi:hypothetical protein